MRSGYNLLPHGRTENNTSDKNKTLRKEVSFPDENEACSYFPLIRDNLRRVNEWTEMAGDSSLCFQITDSNGIAVHRPVDGGDYCSVSERCNSKAVKQHWLYVDYVGYRSSRNMNLFAFQFIQAQSHLRYHNGNIELTNFFRTFITRREQNVISVEISQQPVESRFRTKQKHSSVNTCFEKFPWLTLLEEIFQRASDTITLPYLSPPLD